MVQWWRCDNRPLKRWVARISVTGRSPNPNQVGKGFSWVGRYRAVRTNHSLTTYSPTISYLTTHYLTVNEVE